MLPQKHISLFIYIMKSSFQTNKLNEESVKEIEAFMRISRVAKMFWNKFVMKV